MTVPLPVGLATSIGSLPHTDPVEAARLVLELHPRLPAAPSLPQRSAAEGMLAQAAWAIPGVTIAPDGTLEVDAGAVNAVALDLEGALEAIDLEGDAFVGLRTFLDMVRARTEPIKLQLTGPVTLGIALHKAGASAEAAFATAGAVVQRRAQRMLELATACAPAAPLVVFVDEPGLTATLSRQFPLAAEQVVDLVSGALAVIEPLATTGLHCCGPTDWSLAMQAGPGILSMTLDDSTILSGADLGAYLERGGWVAWGVVPTDRPVGTVADRLWRSLSARWCELVQSGCDPVRLRTQALLTPACGLAHHGLTQATQVLRLTKLVAERLHDQAVGVRLSVGA